MYKVITDEHLQYIKDHPDMTDREIGAVFNINYSTIRGARRRLGLLKDKTIHISKEDFLRTYNECNSDLQLTAKRLNVCRKSLRKIAKEYGIKTDRFLHLSKEAIADICNNYNSCTSVELAIKYNCSPSKISQVWSKHGLIGKTNRTYHLDETYFDEINTPAKAYFIGWIASDGCIYIADTPNKSAIIRISISSQDERVLQLFQQELKTDKPLHYHSTKGCNYVSLEICSDRLVNALVKVGITPKKKTYGNTIPNIPNEFMPHFIRGYFDGDGNINKKWANPNLDKYIRSSASISGYKKNMVKLIRYLENRNIYAQFGVDKRRYNGEDDFGSLSLNNNCSMYCFLKLIYDSCEDFYLERKKICADNFIKHIESDSSIRYKQVTTYYKYAVQIMC